MGCKILVISSDYMYKDEFQAACLKRNVIVDYTKCMAEAVEMLRKTKYCGIIIRDDTINDTESLKIMREMQEMPIILLSYPKPGDTIPAIQNDTQRFLVTPYSIDYLAEKCTALAVYYSQRNENMPHISPTILTYNHLTLLVETHQAFLSGEKIVFTKKEFDLLKYFMSNIGIALTYEQIYNNVWKDDSSFNSHNVLQSLVRRIRDKLKCDPDSNDYITAIRGTGYKFGE